ncbi:MAG: hypothetical protein ACE5KM_18350 [Planctomycetaceae bacterium]
MQKDSPTSPGARHGKIEVLVVILMMVVMGIVAFAADLGLLRQGAGHMLLP